MGEELADPGLPEPAVAAWRRKLLVTAGFDDQLAGTLADDPMDLHALLDLVDRGCPPHLANRILAPLDTPFAPDGPSGMPAA